MASHTSRVVSLSWNDHVLSRYISPQISDTKDKLLVVFVRLKYVSLYPSGSRSGHIHHHDVRVANHHIATLTGHSQEVCGLQWSPDGRYLASGGNDNMVYVWPRVQDGPANQAVHCWSEHQGAVKVSIKMAQVIFLIIFYTHFYFTFFKRKHSFLYAFKYVHTRTLHNRVPCTLANAQTMRSTF